MRILDRVTANINICEVQLAFNGTAVPSNIEGWQPFYNSTFQNPDFEKAYSSIASIEFGEESFSSPAGTSYIQKVTFRFPTSDKYRAERIALLHKIKYVRLVQDNYLDLVIGRNDFFQNKRPSVKTKLNEQLCSVEIECKSIFPSGFTPNIKAYQLPGFIPLTLV